MDHRDDFWVVTLAFLALTAAAAAFGYSLGTNNVPGLPECQEDEYLYPVDEAGRAAYEGPGEASPGDLGCFPFDGKPWQPVLGGGQG
jgi:hypothetical protein